MRSWRNWQTHQLEGLAVAIPWWFESTRPHQNPDLEVAASGDVHTSRTNFLVPTDFARHTIRDRSVLDYAYSRELERDASPTGDGADDEEGFCTRGDRFRQWGVRLLMGKVLATGEEAQERPTRLRDVVTDRAAQHRVPALERVNDGALRDRRWKVELHFAADARQPAQMRRQNDANHGSVWTSTESTVGRSCTMGDQVSPASADAYTCPPLVPK